MSVSQAVRAVGHTAGADHWWWWWHAVRPASGVLGTDWQCVSARPNYPLANLPRAAFYAATHGAGRFSCLDMGGSLFWLVMVRSLVALAAIVIAHPGWWAREPCAGRSILCGAPRDPCDDRYARDDPHHQGGRCPFLWWGAHRGDIPPSLNLSHHALPICAQFSGLCPFLWRPSALSPYTLLTAPRMNQCNVIV